MKTFKKILDTCAPEVMIFGGFLITGALCLATESYDGAAVCAGVAILAAVVAVVRWRRESAGKKPEVFAPGTVPVKKPAKAPPPPESPFPKRRVTKPRRKPVKAKKKPAKRK